jgi:UDP-3-O-[3-hydroxymyristoyl] glucosamine N-acyltransferase
MTPSPPVVATPAFTLADLAARTGAALDGDGSVRITHVAPLDAAASGAIAFLTSTRYRKELATTRASAVILAADAAAATALPKLVHANPYAIYAKIATLLHPRAAPRPGVHPTAVVAEDARVAPSAAIHALAVIGHGAIVGERVEIGAGSVVGAGASLGDDVLLHANVTIGDRCVVGPRTIIHSGAVIGADGFGNAEEGGRWIKIPQLGRVVIGADVEIGASTTIDRGALEDTVIADDVRLDNQIQIGHNCRIGRHTAIAGCVGIAGSVTIGRNCKIGGAAMINGHIELCDGTIIGPATGVMTSTTKPGVYIGVLPAVPLTAWKRMQVELRRLPELARRVRALERNGGAPDAPAADPEEEER